MRFWRAISAGVAALALASELPGCKPGIHDFNEDLKPEGATCLADSDCEATLRCGYPLLRGCGAKGTCVSAAPSLSCNGVPCCAQTSYCGCDGTSVDADAPLEEQGTECPHPDLLASKPVSAEAAPSGACDFAAVGRACASDSDCGSDESCVYAEADGCSATSRTCEINGVMCFSESPYRACDGSIVMRSCATPAGFTPVPVIGPEPVNGG